MARSIVIRVFSIPTSLLAARILGPEIFGILGILNQITVIARVSVFGFEAAAVREIADSRGGGREYNGSKATAYMLDLLTSVGLTLGVLAASFLVADFRFAWGLRIIAGVLMVTHYNRLCIANARLDKNFQLIAVSQVLEQVVNASVILATVVAWGMYGPLMAGIPAGVLVAIILRRYRPYLTVHLQWQGVLNQARVALPLAAGLIIPGLFDWSERLLIARLYGLQELGAYLVVSTFISLGLMAATALMEAISIDILERLGSAEGGGRLPRVATTALTFGMPVLGVGMILFGPALIMWALPEYSNAIALLPWAAAILVIRTSPMVRLFSMTSAKENQQSRHAWYWVLALAVFFVVTLALWAAGVGLVAPMVGKLAGFVVLAGVSLYRGKK